MNSKKNAIFENALSSQHMKIYERAVRSIRYSLARGLTFDEACSRLTDIDQDLKAYITEDFLKILIAEEHFGSGLGIDDMALILGLSCERIEACRVDMIEEVTREITSSNPHAVSTMTH